MAQAYRPGQGISAGSSDKLRMRKDAAEVCEVCGERTEEGGLNCAVVDDSTQWNGLLGEGGGNRKKARCSECTKPLPEDHDPSIGPFCPACAPPRGQWQPAPVAVAPAGEERQIPTEEIQFGHMIRPGICKGCAEERRNAAREEAKAKKHVREQEREQALEDGVLEVSERVSVSLAARPFGMTPSKVDGVGYLVAKVSEGKPAAKVGIRPGWRAVEIAGSSCESLDLEGIQTQLKAAELPVAVTFESVPNGGDFCTSCQRILVWALFSRKMRTKPPDKRRCIACVDAAGVGDADEAEAGTAAPSATATSARGTGSGRGSSGGGYGARGRGRG